MELFQTLHIVNIVEMCIRLLMEIELMLTESQPLELRLIFGSNFWQQFYAIGNGLCVINSSHKFQWIFFKPCTYVVDITKMCMK